MGELRFIRAGWHSRRFQFNMLSGKMPKDDHILIEEAFAQKRMNKATFLRMAKYVRPYRRIFWFNIVFTLLATISQLLGPKFIQLGIDRFLADFQSMDAAMRG